MNRDLMKVIETNLENLRFSVEFDRFDFTREQQESIFKRIEFIQEVINKVKESKV